MANERGGIDGSASIDWSFAAASQAYLPPRSPIYTGIHDNSSFFSNWPNLPHPGTANFIPNRRHHQRTPSTSFISQAPAWVNDLLEDSTTEVAPVKTSHRRSSSDSLAFMEGIPSSRQTLQVLQTDEEGATASYNSNNTTIRGSTDASINWGAASVFPQQKQNIHFPNAIFHSSSSKIPDQRVRIQEASSAATSEHDSANACSSMDEEKTRGSHHQVKNENEVESALKAEQTTSAGDASLLDPKRAKRILANRQSAQRSRVRKLQYISELEKTVNILQEEVSVLSPQVTYLDRHRIILNVDNSAMKQRLAALAQEKLFKDAHNEALKNEVHRLRQLLQHQQQHVSAGTSSMNHQQHLQGTIPLSPPPQLVASSEVGLDATKCTTGYILPDENIKAQDLNNFPPRSPPMKPIGPSACSTGEKTTMHSQVMPGIAHHLHPDVRVQSP